MNGIINQIIDSDSLVAVLETVKPTWTKQEWLEGVPSQDLKLSIRLVHKKSEFLKASCAHEPLCWPLAKTFQLRVMAVLPMSAWIITEVKTPF